MRGGETTFNPDVSSSDDENVRQEEGASELTYPARLKIVGSVPAELREKVDRTEEEIRSIFRGEREKTPEDLESVDYCNQLGRRIGEKYGFEWARVPPDYIHIFSEKNFIKRHRRCPWGDHSPGLVGSTEAWPHADIRDVPSRYFRADTMFHEMCHGESLQRLQLLPKENRKFFLGAKWERKIRRTGLSMRVEKGGKARDFFTDINEAITSRLTQEAFEDFQDDIEPPESLQEESERVRTIKEWMRKDLRMPLGFDAAFGEEELRQVEDLRTCNADSKELSRWEFAYQKEHGIWPLKLSYPNERFEYEAILDYLRNYDPERFKTGDEVHGVFVRAMMQGEILPFARLIEQTFGRGALRTLGEQGLQWLYLKVRSEEQKQRIKPKDNLV